MNPTEYNTVCSIVQKHSGIVLGDSKAYLVQSRLAPVAQQNGFADVGALARDLKMAPQALRLAVVDAMTTNESFFFRDKTPFELFENTMLPALIAARKGSGRLRIWCAAASTGQEPYSLAMLLLAKKHLWNGLSVEIIATDISSSALERARSGRYTQFEVQRGLPVQLLVKHFTQEGNNWVIGEEARSMVRFAEANLLDRPSIAGLVDIVFCRNVLIYFDVETKRAVLDRIVKVLQPDGFLVLGAAETMMGISESFERSAGKRGLYQPTRVTDKRMSA